jgi:hypothetical protein
MALPPANAAQRFTGERPQSSPLTTSSHRPRAAKILSTTIARVRESARIFPAGARGQRGKKRNLAYQKRQGPDRVVVAREALSGMRPARSVAPADAGTSAVIATRQRTKRAAADRTQFLQGKAAVPHADVITGPALPWCMFHAESRPGAT